MTKTVKKAIIVPAIILGTALALFIVFMVSKPSNDDMAAQLSALLPKAEEYSEYIWGGGIPPAPDSDGPLDSVVGSQYRPVDKSYGFENTEQLKSAFSEVFSSGYMTAINAGMFDGYEEMDYSPRYTDVNGQLYVDITNEGSGKIDTRLDPQSARSVYAYGNEVTIEVDGTHAGENITIKVKLIKEDDGWRIDSPVY